MNGNVTNHMQLNAIEQFLNEQLGQRSSCLVDCIDFDKRTQVAKLARPWSTGYDSHQLNPCAQRERASGSRHLRVTELRPGATYLHDGDLSV